MFSLGTRLAIGTVVLAFAFLLSITEQEALAQKSLSGALPVKSVSGSEGRVKSVNELKREIRESNHRSVSDHQKPIKVTGTGKSKAELLLENKSYAEAEQEFRSEIQLKTKEFLSERDQLINRQIGLIKTLRARGEQTKAEEEFKKCFSSTATTFDTAISRDRLRLEFPDLAGKMPERENGLPTSPLSTSDIINRFRGSQHFRHSYNEDFDASDMELSLKQSLRSSESTYGKDSPQKLQTLLDLSTLYIGQFRRAETRGLLSQIGSCYAKLSSDQQHYFALSMLDIAYSLVGLRLVNESSVLYRPVLVAISASNWPMDSEINQKLSNLGAALESQQQFLDAEEVYKASLRMAEKSPGQLDALTLSTQRKHLADLLAKLKKYSTAGELYRMALDAEEKRLGPDNSVTAQTRIQLVKLYLDGGQAPEAKEMLTQILKSVESTDEAHAREYQRRLIELGDLLMRHGDLETARDIFDKSLGLALRTGTLTARDYSYHIDPLAKAFTAQGQTEQTVKLYDRFIKAFEETGKSNSRDYLNMLQQVARFYLEHDMFDSAMPRIKMRIELGKRTAPVESRSVIREFAELLNRKERYADAQSVYEEIAGEEPPKERDLFSQYLQDQMSLMLVYSHQNKYVDAERTCLRCLDALNPYLLKASPSLKVEVERLLKNEIAKNDYQSAQGILSNLIYTDFVRGSGTDVVNALMQIAWRYRATEKVISIMRQCAELAQKNYGAEDARTAQILTRFADQLRQQGMEDEASAVTKQADEIRSKLLNRK